MSRSIPAAKMRQRDPQFVETAEAGWYAAHGADPLSTPLRDSGDLNLPGRTGELNADATSFTSTDGRSIELRAVPAARTAGQGLLITAPDSEGKLGEIVDVGHRFAAHTGSAGRHPGRQPVHQITAVRTTPNPGDRGHRDRAGHRRRRRSVDLGVVRSSRRRGLLGAGERPMTGLQALFRPDAVAVVGASSSGGKLGAVMARSLAGYGRGPVLVNSRTPDPANGVYSSIADAAAARTGSDRPGRAVRAGSGHRPSDPGRRGGGCRRRGGVRRRVRRVRRHRPAASGRRPGRRVPPPVSAC